MNGFWKKVIGTVTGIIAVAGLLFGVSTYEQKFARAADVAELREAVVALSNRVEFNRLSDRLHELEKRVWYMEKEFGGEGAPRAPASVKETYFRLRQEMRDVKRRLEKLKGG